MKYTNSIAMAAIMLAVAFAGIALVADDADAADAVDVDGLGDYKITYTFNGSSIVKKTNTGNAFQFTKQDAYVAPEGYELKGWKDVASNTVFQLGPTYTIVADTVVEPYLGIMADWVVFTLDIDGKSDSLAIKKTEIGKLSEKLDVTYKALLEEAGLADLDSKEGYQFGGFAVEGLADEPFTGADVDEIAQKIANAIVAKYPGDTFYGKEFTLKAVFTPVYELAFIVDGTQVTSINSNEFGELPSNPVKEHFIFVGWAVDGKVVTSVENGAIVFPEGYVAALTADTKFTAVFEPVKLTVTFDVDGKKSEATVLYGNTVMRPEAPVKEGFEFVAWMNGEVEFDFAKAVTEDMTLTAKFKEVTAYNITFKQANGFILNVVSSDNIAGFDIVAPAIEDMKFVGWSNGVEIVKDYKTYEYTKDTTLTAVYTEADPAPEPPFFKTTVGQCVGVLIGFLIVVFVYLMITDAYGMRTATMSFLRRKKD